jgi:hypothetical protein
VLLPARPTWCLGTVLLTSLQDGGNEDAPAPEEGDTTAAEAATEEVQPQPLSDITNKINADSSKSVKDKKDKAARPAQKRERGPPADGIPSKNKVMVANLPYDLTEEKVRSPLHARAWATGWSFPLLTP